LYIIQISKQSTEREKKLSKILSYGTEFQAYPTSCSGLHCALIAMATNDAVLTVALVTQSATEVAGSADALVVASVCSTAARRPVVTAASAFSAQLVALAGVLLNVVTNVQVCRHLYIMYIRLSK